MSFIDDIKKKLFEEEFSLEVLNDCRMYFQYGGFDENDRLEFKKLLTLNINKYYPDGYTPGSGTGFLPGEKYPGSN